MNDAEFGRYITDTFEDVDVVVDSGNSFYYYNPEYSVPPDYKLMFATIVTSDLYDQYSNLNRPSVFRLNFGIGKQTFRSIFAVSSPSEDSDDTVESSDKDGNYDYTALDELMPHPEYGRIYWVCVLSPSDQTFETTVRSLLAEAYEVAVGKHNKQAARR